MNFMGSLLHKARARPTFFDMSSGEDSIFEIILSNRIIYQCASCRQIYSVERIKTIRDEQCNENNFYNRKTLLFKLIGV